MDLLKYYQVSGAVILAKNLPLQSLFPSICPSVYKHLGPSAKTATRILFKFMLVNIYEELFISFNIHLTRTV